MSYFKQHVFFCTNAGSDDRSSCQDHSAQELRYYLKKRVKEERLAGRGGVRVNNAGCLGRCGKGPVIVIYPDEIWYQYNTKEDLDEIFEKHIKNNERVERLLI